MEIMGFELPDALGKIIKKERNAEYDSFEEFERELKKQIDESRKCGEITAARAAYLRWRFLSGQFWKVNCDAIEIQRKEGYEEGYEEGYRLEKGRVDALKKRILKN